MQNAGIKPITIALKVDMDNANKQALKAANETTNAVVGAYARLGTLKIAAIGAATSAVAGVGAALLFGAGAASRFEESFAGIKKTVDASESEFDRLAVSIRELSTEIPIAVNQLNQIGELGGQLGIEASGLPVFIETIAKLGVSTRLSTETAALSLARLKEIFQLQEYEIENMASSLVDLGNNFAALEDEILSTSLRLAAGAKVAGATVSDTLAIATALQAVGVQSQAGGTAMSRVFQQLTVAMQGNTKSMKVFVETTGLTEEAFKKIASEDPAQALNLFIQGLSRIGKTGGNVIGVLEEIGLKQQRTIRALLSVAEAGDLLTDALARSNTAYEINNALNEEAAKRFETLKSQSKLMKNAFQELKIEVGNNFLPLLKNITGAITAMVNGMGNSEKSMDQLSRATVAIVGTFTLLGTALSAIAGNFFAIRAQAAEFGLSLAQYKLALTQVRTEAELAALGANRATQAYAILSRTIASAMSVIAPALFLVTIALGAQANANAKAKRAAEQYSETLMRTVPLQAKLNSKIAEYEELLADPNIKVEALEALKREIEIITEEVGVLNSQLIQTFYNIPTFRPDFSLEEILKAEDAFNRVTGGVEQLSEAQAKIEDLSGVNFYSSLFEDAVNPNKTKVIENLARVLRLDEKDVQEMIKAGDMQSFTYAMYRALLLDDKAAMNVGSQMVGVVEDALTKLKKVDTKDFSIGEKLELNKAIEDAEMLQVVFKNLQAISPKEAKMLEGNLEDIYKRYLDLAKETSNVQIFSYDSFVKNPETAAYIFDVIAGRIKDTTNEAESFEGRISDIVGKLTQAVAESADLKQIFEGLGDIEIQSPADLMRNIEEYKAAQKFLEIAITEFTDRGLLALALEAAEGGTSAENIGKIFSMLSDDIPLDTLILLNDSLVDSEEKYADLSESNAETLAKVEEQLRVNYGIQLNQLSADEQRLIINQLLQKTVKTDENHAKNVLNVTKEIIQIGRERVDTAKELAELQQKIDDFNKSSIYTDITITAEKKVQVEQAEALVALNEALSEHGREGVVTDKESIKLLQATLNIERMREKLSQTRTAREQKSIRDKKNEVKFLEMAVEQGVADQLDLDAAKEELNDMLNPLSQAEKELLELQLKVAEAEKLILDERTKSLSPELISAIDNYNASLNIGTENAKKLADMEEELARKTQDANIQSLEQSIRLDEIKQKYPGLKSILEELGGMIGMPAGVLTEIINSYDASYNAFLATTAKIKAAAASWTGTIGAGGAPASTLPPPSGPGSFNYRRIQGGIPIHSAPYVPPEYGDPSKSGPINPATKTTVPTEKETPWWLKAARWITDPASRNIPQINLPSISNTSGVTGFGAYPGQTLPDMSAFKSTGEQIGVTDLVNEFILKNIGKGVKSIDWNQVMKIQNSWMGNAYGGNVPIGRTSVVGEMGPEVIMSTPSGTSVFSNKTGGGYGGVTVQNMNVNITGLPADPIAARKAAINIRKELMKLEKEGNAGTGLRNR